MTEDIPHLRRYQALLAPGTPLRSGLERILAGRTGALVVLGTNRIVKASCSGGFPIDIEYQPTRLRELAKMDGGIVLSNDLSTIIAAGVHVVSDPVPSAETGTRHRSADQLAQVSGVPVVTVSASMSSISLFMAGERYAIERSEQILQRANQALATLSSYHERLDAVLRRLTALEVRDQVNLRDLLSVAQRYELIRRLSDELQGYVAALGVDGRLVSLQLAELTRGMEDLPSALAQDYSPDNPISFDRLAELSDADLLDLGPTARAIGFDSDWAADARLSPRGIRVLTSIPRLPQPLAERLIERFGTLQNLLGASVADLQQVDGVGASRARSIRETLLGVSESAYHSTD